jgi:glutathione S-transferase
MDYIDIEAAKEMGGLRLVLTQGVPGPWGEAAKGVLHVKQIPYAPVAQQGGGGNEALVAWTGFANAPQALYQNERPRIGWSEILFLAERLAPSPSLIPNDPQERALMFGLLHEIAGEMGFAWTRRLQLFHPLLSLPEGKVPAAILDSVGRMAARYDYSAEGAAGADARVEQLLELFSAQLRKQQLRGSAFFIGDALSAADIYWATFAAMVTPLPEEQNPMPAMLRTQYTITSEAILSHADDILLEHRDYIYANYLPLPLTF